MGSGPTIILSVSFASAYLIIAFLYSILWSLLVATLIGKVLWNVSQHEFNKQLIN
jgi:hypothetical protein